MASPSSRRQRQGSRSLGWVGGKEGESERSSRQSGSVGGAESGDGAQASQLSGDGARVSLAVTGVSVGQSCQPGSSETGKSRETELESELREGSESW